LTIRDLHKSWFFDVTKQKTKQPNCCWHYLTENSLTFTFVCLSFCLSIFLFLSLLFLTSRNKTQNNQIVVGTTEWRWKICLKYKLSHSLFCLSVCVCVSAFPSLYLSFLSVPLFLCLCHYFLLLFLVFLSPFLSVSLYLCLSLFISVCLSISLCLAFCLSKSLYLSFFLSISLYLCIQPFRLSLYSYLSLLEWYVWYFTRTLKPMFTCIRSILRTYLKYFFNLSLFYSKLFYCSSQ